MVLVDRGLTPDLCALGKQEVKTVPLHLASCNLMERFLSSNNGMVIGNERGYLTRLMDSAMAEWNSREDRSCGGNRAVVYHFWV